MIAVCGTLQASIAWPDRPAERFIIDDMARNGVEEIVTFSDLVQWKPPADMSMDEIVAKLKEDSHEPQFIVPGVNLSEQILANTANDPAGKIVIPEGLTAENLIDGTVTEIGLLPDGSPAIIDPEKSIVNEDTPPSINGPGTETAPPAITEAQAIRNYLAEHGSSTANKVVIAALKEAGYKIESTQVSAAKKEMAESAKSDE